MYHVIKRFIYPDQGTSWKYCLKKRKCLLPEFSSLLFLAVFPPVSKSNLSTWETFYLASVNPSNLDKTKFLFCGKYIQQSHRNGQSTCLCHRGLPTVLSLCYMSFGLQNLRLSKYSLQISLVPQGILSGLFTSVIAVNLLTNQSYKDLRMATTL